MQGSRSTGPGANAPLTVFVPGFQAGFLPEGGVLHWRLTPAAPRAALMRQLNAAAVTAQAPKHFVFSLQFVRLMLSGQYLVIQEPIAPPEIIRTTAELDPEKRFDWLMTADRLWLTPNENPAPASPLAPAELLTGQAMNMLWLEELLPSYWQGLSAEWQMLLNPPLTSHNDYRIFPWLTGGLPDWQPQLPFHFIDSGDAGPYQALCEQPVTSEPGRAKATIIARRSPFEDIDALLRSLASNPLVNEHSCFLVLADNMAFYVKQRRWLSRLWCRTKRQVKK